MSSPSVDMQLLAARIDRLERQNRWLKLIGGAATACVLVVLLAGAGPKSNSGPLVIRAANGDYAQLNAEGLTVYDKHGVERGFFGLTDAETGEVHLYDSGGNRRMSLFVSHQPEISLLNTGGSHVIDIFVGKDTGEPELDLNGPTGQERVTLNGSKLPYLRERDGSGNVRGYIGMYTDGSAGAFLKTADGTITWQAPASK